MKTKYFKIILFLLFLAFILIFNKLLPSNPTTYPIKSDEYKFTKITPFMDDTIETNFNIIYCSAFQTAWNKLCNNIIKDKCKTSPANFFTDRLNNFTSNDSIISDNLYLSEATFSNSDKISSTNNEIYQKFKIKNLVNSNFTDNSIILFSILSNKIKFECDFDYICYYPYFNSTPIKAFGIEFKKTKIIHYQLVKQIDILYTRLFSITREQRDSLKFPAGPITLPEGFIIRLNSNNSSEEIILSTLPPANNLINSFITINNLINKDFKEYLNDSNSNEIILKLMQNHLFLDRLATFQMPEIKFNIIKKYNELINQKIINCFNYKIGEALQIINIDFTMNGKKIPINDFESILKSIASCGCGSQTDNYRVTKPFIIYIRNLKSKLPYFMAYISNTELITPNEFTKINDQGETIYNKEDSLDKSDQ